MVVSVGLVKTGTLLVQRGLCWDNYLCHSYCKSRGLTRKWLSYGSLSENHGLSQMHLNCLTPLLRVWETWCWALFQKRIIVSLLSNIVWGMWLASWTYNGPRLFSPTISSQSVSQQACDFCLGYSRFDSVPGRLAWYRGFPQSFNEDRAQ
jgi:hypothetical protein